MDVARLLGSLIGGAFSARGKPHRRASSFLTGGRGSFLSGSSLLSAAALGFGAYEVWRTTQGGSTSNATIGSGPRSTIDVVPSVPTTPSAHATPPPLPTADPSDGLARIAGLLICAARADGELGEEEYGRILTEAKAQGADRQILAELATPRPLAEIVGAVHDPKLKADLYVLAFTVVRADSDVNERERAWLADLARLLALDEQQARELEEDVARRMSRPAP